MSKQKDVINKKNAVLFEVKSVWLVALHSKEVKKEGLQALHPSSKFLLAV